MEISFHFVDIDTFTIGESKLTNWVAESILLEQHVLQSLDIVFCSDEYLLDINQKYLSHDYYTDIITFDNSEKQRDIEGDIFISVERVRENALIEKTTFENELHRVIIHGVLHLVGYGDNTSEEKTIMRNKENAYLSLLQK